MKTIGRTDYHQAAATTGKEYISRPSMMSLLDEQIPDSLRRLGLYLHKRKAAQALLGSNSGRSALTTLKTESGSYLCAMTSCGFGRKGWLERIFLPLSCDGRTKRRILGVRGWRRVVSIHLYLLGLEIPRFLKKVLHKHFYKHRNPYSPPQQATRRRIFGQEARKPGTGGQ